MSANLTVTDLFAGAGGSSTGMVSVPGVEVRMAANHWKLAVDVHNTNHPDTDHAAVDLHLEDPRYFPRTDLLWASPECTKWSQANGSKPRPAIEEGLFEDPPQGGASRDTKHLGRAVRGAAATRTRGELRAISVSPARSKIRVALCDRRGTFRCHRCSRCMTLSM